MSLPLTGWLGNHRRNGPSVPGDRLGGPGRHRVGQAGRHRAAWAWLRLPARPGPRIVVLAGAAVVITACLELANPGNFWVLFEDLGCAIAPLAGMLALLVTVRQEREYRLFRGSLAACLALTSFGQVVRDVPDAIPGLGLGLIGTMADAANGLGAVLAVSVCVGSLYGRLESSARRTVALDGFIITFAAMTFVVANWLLHSLLPGTDAPILRGALGSDLVIPLLAALFFASAAAIVVAALALRIEPSFGGVWLMPAGIVLLSLAWEGWIARFVAGGADRVEIADFVFPAGVLIAAYGGTTWSLRPGGGERYERLADWIANWLPIAAIAGCALLDVMPRRRPFELDPIAAGTCLVVLLGVTRQRMLQGKEKRASDRLTGEMRERAATAMSLSRLEPAATVEATAERICAEALRIEGIDRVIVFVFGPSGVVPLAQGGPPSRPVPLGQPLPADKGRELREHAEFGVWLESWMTKPAEDDFDQATIASGLRAEALAPLFWEDEPIGLLALGATTAVHARQLGDRLPTLTEFSVMSAAVLGPMLGRRWQRERDRNELETVIATAAFYPVFQPIVDLETRTAVGYEALTRFHDGTRPDLRFVAAEKVGMSIRLESACLKEQLKQARNLPEGRWLSLNVSPGLAIEPDVLMPLLRRAGRPLVLEVTEHVEIDDYQYLLKSLARIRRRVRLAVDDAGAGYAGLRHILELRPQFVKLDISLVRNVDSDRARQAMISGMAHFAADVGCDMIAEGIETPNELEALRLLGVAYGQGYLLGRPEPLR